MDPLKCRDCDAPLSDGRGSTAFAFLFNHGEEERAWFCDEDCLYAWLHSRQYHGEGMDQDAIVVEYPDPRVTEIR